MKCVTCGAEGALWCSHCGRPVVAEERATGTETVSLSEEVAAQVRARNAAPDAGDVEALANDMWWTYHNDFHGEIVKQGTMGVMRLLAGGVVRRYAARESTLRAERDAALAAEAATLRGALERIANAQGNDAPQLRLMEIASDALATPASPATARYAAVIDAARLLVKSAEDFGAMPVTMPIWMRLAYKGLRNHLRALDAPAGATDAARRG